MFYCCILLPPKKKLIFINTSYSKVSSRSLIILIILTNQNGKIINSSILFSRQKTESLMSIWEKKKISDISSLHSKFVFMSSFWNSAYQKLGCIIQYFCIKTNLHVNSLFTLFLSSSVNICVFYTTVAIIITNLCSYISR